MRERGGGGEERLGRESFWSRGVERERSEGGVWESFLVSRREEERGEGERRGGERRDEERERSRGVF